jgi:hypothetical protein
MITAVVRFPLRQGTTLEAATEMFERSAPNYRGVAGLIRKYYLFGEDRVGGGVYLWESREAADRLYTDAWKKTIVERFGAEPKITFYETPVIVENTDGSAATKAA